ncbi:hypothetical protein UFOVP1382_97 [uncultured Caudovirales phage]|uniref:Uncharacterized protein n=1 Tax=uncultured Caudovirales phage TaxID=2100421 RepID=A0A6J5RXK7_9CAUD|nr:hypothetical protein UFOVP1382_97 [uncultured Caudovirales phage]
MSAGRYTILPGPTTPAPGPDWVWHPVDQRWKPKDAISIIKSIRDRTGCSLADAVHAARDHDYDLEASVAAVMRDPT